MSDYDKSLTHVMAPEVGHLTDIVGLQNLSEQRAVRTFECRNNNTFRYHFSRALASVFVRADFKANL